MLPADEGEALAEFEQERLKVVQQAFLQLFLRKDMRFGDFQELENVGVSQEVGGFFHHLAFLGEFQDAFFVLAGGEAEEKGGGFLPLQFLD